MELNGDSAPYLRTINRSQTFPISEAFLGETSVETYRNKSLICFLTSGFSST